MTSATDTGAQGAQGAHPDDPLVDLLPLEMMQQRTIYRLLKELRRVAEEMRELSEQLDTVYRDGKS